MAAIRSTTFHLAPLISPDEYLVILVNAGPFDSLLRKDDFFDEGVAAVFGLVGGTAELLGLCFQVGKFSPERATAWLAERRFSPTADAPTVICAGSPAE